MLPQKCEFVCPVLKFGEEICFPRNVCLSAPFWNLGKKCFPRNVNLPSLFLNLGKKYASPEMWDCLPYFLNLGKNYASPEMWVCLPWLEIMGRHVLPQKCEFAFPVFKFGEEICVPRNICLSALFWNLGKKYASPGNSSLSLSLIFIFILDVWHRQLVL